MGGPAIVELARAAVRRLADAAPAARDARLALARIERVGLGPPYTVVIAGDPGERAELLDALAGERLFAPAPRELDRIVLQLRRGPATALRARRRDGSVEDRALDAARREDRAATVAAGDDPGFRDAVALSAEAATTAMVPSPPWWAVWRRIAAWWRRRRIRARALAAPAAPAPARRGFANTVARGRRAGDPRQDFVDAMAGWLADPAVEKLFVEVGGGALSDQVVVIELPAGANARSLDAMAADACLVACGARGFAMTEQLEIALGVVPHLFAIGASERGPGDPRVRRIAAAAAVAGAELVRLAVIERALAVGERAAAALAAGSAALDVAITRAETGFRARLDRLEAMQVGDPDGHIAGALARTRPAVVEHVRQLLRRALDELDAAIGGLGAAWSARLGEASSTEALRAAAAQIDDESPAALQAAQAAAHRALLDGLTARARAHHGELVGALRRGTSRDDDAPAWLTAEVEIAELSSSTSLGAVAPRLTSLFRSLDALRGEALAQLEQRIAKLRQVASANLLDTEPRLEPAVTGALAIALRGELERHASWLDAELARERVAIDAERAQLAVLALIRDTARSDERELVSSLDALAAELP